MGRWGERGGVLGFCERAVVEGDGGGEELREEKRLNKDRGVLGRGESEDEVKVCCRFEASL